MPIPRKSSMEIEFLMLEILVKKILSPKARGQLQ
jgi:hypothetical protein